MAASKKTETIRVRVSELTKIELQALAKTEQREFSDYLRIELEKLIAKKKLPDENT
jgi:antitoxin component of RelBE/YafQ-DinJ toxin-antitoxin module